MQFHTGIWRKACNECDFFYAKYVKYYEYTFYDALVDTVFNVTLKFFLILSAKHIAFQDPNYQRVSQNVENCHPHNAIRVKAIANNMDPIHNLDLEEVEGNTQSSYYTMQYVAFDTYSLAVL